MREFLNITKALSDENRVRALLALAGGELCLCQIIELLGLAPLTVSKHMTLLHQAGLVESRKDGRWTFYSTATDSGSPQARAALDMTLQCLAKDPKGTLDAKRLRAIRKMDRDTLCCHYHT